MGKQPIIVAAQELVGGTKEKPFTLPANAVVDAEACKSLAISGKKVDALIASGVLVEQDAFVEAAPSEAPPPAKFDGLSADQMRQALTDAGVSFDTKADAAALFQTAIAYEAPDPLAAAVVEIEQSMDVKAIKGELDKLQVPYETDANKPALALALAQARSAKA